MKQEHWPTGMIERNNIIPMKTIAITGASSGIGKEAAKLFVTHGWRVAATMRKPGSEKELSELEGVKLYELDVTDTLSIQQCAKSILKDHQGIDIVLNNAGYGLVGPFEAATPEQIQRQFNTNVFGLMEVSRAFLPYFRSKRAGMLINVSSLGGLITYPFTSLYHSSKWAVEGFSESLSFELGELGIQVKLIEPGAVSTDFSGRSMDFAMPNDLPDYGPPVQKFLDAQKNSDRVPATPEEIAQGIYEAATDGKQQLRYLLGDAPHTIKVRKEAGDDEFIAAMKARIFDTP
ncbi:MAG: SDR family oxidoreductase [Cytophagales bacterium]|nr:SDR family oxidoreductase [Cytophagales bacterium]